MEKRELLDCVTHLFTISIYLRCKVTNLIAYVLHLFIGIFRLRCSATATLHFKHKRLTKTLRNVFSLLTGASVPLKSWGLFYNRCVRTNPALKEAYATSYAKGGIYKTILTHLHANSDPCLPSLFLGVRKLMKQTTILNSVFMLIHI